MAENNHGPEHSERDRLLEENRLLAQRYLELERSTRLQLEKLRSANALLSRGDADVRTLLENAAVGFALVDLNMRVVTANQALCALLGYSRLEIPGENFHSFVYVGKLPAFARLAGQTADRSRSQDGIDLVARDGRLLPCRVTVADWLDDEGAARGYFLLVFNVDDEMQAAARLREVEAAMAETAKSRDLFLEVVSRELRSPANGIMGMIRMLMDDDLTERQAELAGVIHSSASSLVRIVDDVVDIARADSGKLVAGHRPFNPADLAEGVLDLFAVRAEEKGLELRVHVSAAVPESIMGDAGMVRKVLVHLFDNAFKFTDRGHVSLTVDVVADSLRFMVSDTGSGVGGADARDLLDDYPPDDSPASRRRGGIGVGLSVSRRLVSAMGGKIGYESEPGRGSEFHFAIPLVPCDGEDDAARLEPPPEAMRLPPLSILLADSNPLSRRLVDAYLRFDGHRVSVVDNGLEAADKSRQTAFDLVLLDLHLPKLDGMQTLRLIRDDEKTGGRRRVPVLIMAPAGRLREEDFYRRAGADGAVAKPVRAVELMAFAARATGVQPVAVARQKAPGQYAAEARGASIRRIDATQLVNLGQVMPRDQFHSLLRFFMEDAVPGILGLADAAAQPEPDPERIAFTASKARGFAAYLGFSALADLLRRLENAGRTREDADALRRLAGELPPVFDDTMEELKRILPDAFATISAMTGALPEEGDGGS